MHYQAKVVPIQSEKINVELFVFSRNSATLRCSHPSPASLIDQGKRENCRFFTQVENTGIH